MTLKITNATYEGKPFYGPEVSLSDMVTGRYFGEWAVAATIIFEKQLPDGTWQEIARAGIEFYHIPDVVELEVTTTPISKLYDGDTTSVRIAGIGSDGQPAKLPDATIINVAADDGGAGVGGLYWMGSSGPYVAIHNMPLGNLNAGALTYVVPQTEDPPPAQPALRL